MQQQHQTHHSCLLLLLLLYAHLNNSSVRLPQILCTQLLQTLVHCSTCCTTTPQLLLSSLPARLGALLPPPSQPALHNLQRHVSAFGAV
jgi:hypothetical protein